MNDEGVNRLNSQLDAREYEARIVCDESQDQYVANLWMVVKDRTLQVVNNVSCNLTKTINQSSIDVGSEKAYNIVNVTYPQRPVPPESVPVAACRNLTRSQDPCESDSSRAQKQMFSSSVFMFALFTVIMIK